MGHHVDVHVGLRIRQRRRLLKMSLEELAGRSGVQPQQLQKYEMAENRIGASRLWAIASALKVPVDFFFRGMDGEACDENTRRAAVLTDPDALRLIRAYRMLPKEQRKQILSLARMMGANA